MNAKSTVIPLDYAPAPRNRRWVYRAITAPILLVSALSAWKWGFAGWQRVETLYWQRQCLQLSLPPDTVVYEEDPTLAAALLAGNPQYHPCPLQRRTGAKGMLIPVTAAALDCAYWNKLSGTLPRSYSPLNKPAIIFLHERKSPAGNRRLVCVRYGPSGETFNTEFIQGFNCDAFSVTPGSWSGPPIYKPQGWTLDILSYWPRTPPRVRIFAGQPDSRDPAHFTIRYRMWGHEDVLDGRLLDNDQVTLTSRKQPSDR